MATYDYDIANLALARLGQGQITSLGQAGRDATICNLFYTQNRDWCLEKVPWLSIKVRTHMQRAGKVKIGGITAEYSGDSQVTVLASGHSYVAGDLVTLEDVTSRSDLDDSSYYVYGVSSQTLVLVPMDEVDDYVYSITIPVYLASGGYVYYSPGDEWDYVYDLHSSCLKIERILDDEWGWDDSYRWVRVQNRVYTNIEHAAVEYLKKETDPAVYDARLVDFMAARLAWLICPRISNDAQLRSTLQNEWMLILAEAEMATADAGSDDGEAAPLWTEGHL